MKDYKILMSEESFKRAESYLAEIKNGQTPGYYLRKKLEGIDIRQISVGLFIELLIGTKLPQIFAESAVSGDGSDWNREELSILGDINIAAPVTVFDNGEHSPTPHIHEIPFKGTLLFTPGALLRNGRSLIPADWEVVAENGEIDPENYYRLYERRLLPLFFYADKTAKEENRRAFITIPGLGCGQFAGKFHGTLGNMLKIVLQRLLHEHGGKFPNIKAVYYDPFRECANERLKIEGIDFLIRPLMKGNNGKSQLCRPEDFEEEGDDFSNCRLFSLVAWDHVSWPGNDFYIGSRATDDGVKAAATDVMKVMTGIEGGYKKSSAQYTPPESYRNWWEVVNRNNIEIEVTDNLVICIDKTGEEKFKV